MAKVKVSKAGMAALVRLVAGSGFYVTNDGKMGATRQMESNLQRGGYIQRTDDDRITITPTGRALVEQTAGEEGA